MFWKRVTSLMFLFGYQQCSENSCHQIPGTWNTFLALSPNWALNTHTRAELVSTQSLQIKNKCLHLVKAWKSGKCWPRFHWQQETSVCVCDGCLHRFWDGYDSQAIKPSFNKCTAIGSALRGTIIPGCQAITGRKGENMSRKFNSQIPDLMATGAAISRYWDCAYARDKAGLANILLLPLQFGGKCSDNQMVSSGGKIFSFVFMAEMSKCREISRVRKNTAYLRLEGYGMLKERFAPLSTHLKSGELAL